MLPRYRKISILAERNRQSIGKVRKFLPRFWLFLKSIFLIIDVHLFTSTSQIFFIIHLRGRIWKISQQLARILRLPDDEITISVIYLTLFYTMEDLMNIPFLIYYAVYMDCGSGPKKVNYDVRILSQTFVIKNIPL